VMRDGFTVTTLRHVKSNMKSMIITFFDKGIVHKEYVPKGQTVNSGFYCDVLRRMRENLRRHRPILWREQNCLLHHDKARSHTSILAQHFLAKNKILSPPPTVIPWFATLWLLPISKMKLRWKDAGLVHWGDTESACHCDRKGLTGSVPKIKKIVGTVSTYERKNLRGWRCPISIMVSFTIFTASVSKYFGSTSYLSLNIHCFTSLRQ
jgi:hypothetical protein